MTLDPDFERNFRNFLEHAGAATLRATVALVCEEFRERALPGVGDLCRAEHALALWIAAAEAAGVSSGLDGRPVRRPAWSIPAPE